MSKLALSGNVNGSGTFTIASPDSNNSRTMNLPDSAGDLVVTQAVQTLSNKTFSGAQTFGTASLAQPTGNAPLFMCRAWVNFNSTTTPLTIRASGNVSSITANGVGDFTINFTTAMPDVNYALSGMIGGTNTGPVIVYDFTQAAPRATTSFRVALLTLGGGLANDLNANVAVFR